MVMSTKTDSPPSVATPRKSNLARGRSDGMDDDDAPLGFEPEGSAAAATPPFPETTATPPYYKWAENIGYLLEDGDGVGLFSEFLEQENVPDVLDFFFAVKGLKEQKERKKADQVQLLIKAVFKRYLRGDGAMLILRPETRRVIQEKMTNKKVKLDPGIFDDAQSEVLDYLSGAPYEGFLKSDIYVKYVQNGGGSESAAGDSVDSSGSSSGAGSHAGTRPVSQGFLPTVHEDEELAFSDVPYVNDDGSGAVDAKRSMTAKTTRVSTDGETASSSNVMPLSLKSLRDSYPSRLTNGATGEYPTLNRSRNVDAQGRNLNPYHMTYCTSYNPVSAQDSELQSSSDALTDTDTKSMTDSSLDRFPLGDRYQKRRTKQELQAMRRSAAQNPDELVTHHKFIPRTERVPKDVKPMAETDFDRFAHDLSQRLEKVLEKQQKEEKLQESLQKLSLANEQERHKRAAEGLGVPPPVPRKTGVSISGSGSGVTNSLKGLFYSTLLAPRGDGVGVDHEAQAILDEHVSNWDRSGHHTPNQSRSPPNGRKGSSSAVPFAATQRHRRHHKGGPPSMGAAMGSNRTVENVFPKDGISYSGSTADHVNAGKGSIHAGGHRHPSQPMVYYKASVAHQGMEMMNQAVRNVAAHRSQLPEGAAFMGQPSSHSNVGPGYYVGGNASATTAAGEGQGSSEKVIAWMQNNENFSSDYKKSGSSYEASEGRSSARNRSERGNGSASHKSTSGQQQGSQSPAPHRNERSNKRAVAAVAPTMPSGVVSGHHLPTSYHHFGPPGTPLASNSVWPGVAPNAMDSHRSTGFGVPRQPASGSASLSNEKAFKKTAISNPHVASSVAPSVSVSGESSVTTICGYYFCQEPIPYRVPIPGSNPTLAQFKNVISKRGNFRYFFKKKSDEFDSGVVFAEISDDAAPLPFWEGKIVGKVERVD